MGEQIDPSLPYCWAEIIWSCRNEMVYHLEDIMARRTRALLLNARASIEIAEKVAEKIAPLLNWTEERKQEEIVSFRNIAKKYVLK